MSAAEDTLPTTDTARAVVNNQAAIEAERLTAERIRAVLSAAGVNGQKREALRRRIYDLFGAHGGGDLEETPEFFVLLYESGAFGLRYDEAKSHDAQKARRLYDDIIELAERYEPEEHKVARRCIRVWERMKDEPRSNERDRRAYNFALLFDQVSEDAGEDLRPNPGHEYFIPIFTKSARTIGRDAESYVELKEALDKMEAEGGAR
jgi:hypothetical protein